MYDTTNDAVKQPDIVFLKGRKTTLRPVQKNDLANCLRWINDPEVTRFTRGFLPRTEKFEAEWYENLDKRKDDVVFSVIADDKHIGIMGIHGIEWKDRVASTGAIIGDKEYWGKGFGTDAKMQIMNYAFNTLNLRKLWSKVRAFNERSFKYCIKCGYVVEGTLRKQSFCDGEYFDEIVLGVFREEWLPVWEKYSNPVS